jgi:hypothetical protein
VNGTKFVLALVIAAAATFGAARLIDNAYVFFAGYVVLQYIALATAWNILGGYTGYVNFGTAAFFALGAYTTVVLHKLTSLPLPLMMPIGGIVSGIVGLGTGYLTLRLRGAFFSIATLALAVVVQTLITNWDFVGGSRGAYIIRPPQTPLLGIDYIQYLFLLMLGLVVIVLATARALAGSALGWGSVTNRVAVLRDISRSDVGVQPGIRGQRRGDAVGWRNIELAGAGDRRDPAGDLAAGCHGDDLIRGQSADRRADAGRVRHRGAEWDFGAGRRPRQAGRLMGGFKEVSTRRTPFLPRPIR